MEVHYRTCRPLKELRGIGCVCGVRTGKDEIVRKLGGVGNISVKQRSRRHRAAGCIFKNRTASPGQIGGRTGVEK